MICAFEIARKQKQSKGEKSMRSKIYTILLMVFTVARAFAANPGNPQPSSVNAITSGNLQNNSAIANCQNGNEMLQVSILAKASRGNVQYSYIANDSLSLDILEPEGTLASQPVTDGINNNHNPELNLVSRTAFANLLATEKTSDKLGGMASLTASPEIFAKVKVSNRLNKNDKLKLDEAGGNNALANMLVPGPTNPSLLGVVLPAANTLLANGGLASYRVKEIESLLAPASSLTIAAGQLRGQVNQQTSMSSSLIPKA
jgi:hypothetical protein